MQKIFEFYINSKDFNGIPFHSLISQFDENELRKSILELINEEKITITTTNNPHIKLFPEESKQKQIEKFENYDGMICIYPSPSYLKKNMDSSKYVNEPFKRDLLLGKAQLEPVYFELPVLDIYFNDPRYLILNSDYSGSISVKDVYDSVPEKDKISLQTFGLGYNENGERVIIVFLRYLTDLSPEHQQIWKTYRIEGKCAMDPDYFINNILGDFTDGVSIFDAFCEELFQINEMCKLIGKKPLFKQDFKNKRPDEFKIFLKPTLKNYNDFVLVLDKMLSENINKDFFRGEMELTEEILRKDGTKEVRHKGTIRLFEEWLKSKFKTDEEFFKTIFDPLKQIRKERQDPAHRIDENVYDKNYHEKQDDLLNLAYTAIRHIRLALSNHPNLKDYKVPEWLYDGKVRRYVKDEFKSFDDFITKN